MIAKIAIETMGPTGMDIGELPNIGPVSAAWLRETGVGTVAELEACGPVRAFLAVRATGREPSLNLLWALAAGLRREHWTKLPPTVKTALRRELERATSESSRGPDAS